MGIKDSIRKNLIYLLPGLTAAAIDQILKRRAETHPEEFKEIVQNRGFAGGRLSERRDIVRNTSLLTNSFGFVLLPFIDDSTLAGKIKKAGWGFMTGAALSNTLDRVIRGYVVDFLPRGKYVYNISDFAIGTGTAAFLAGELMNYFTGEKDPETRRVS
ncbi:MAG: signal peptidase II [Lachnospiraceae bacterium]|nr:signal peptidase II [Lachnospiraceae bacterium]